MEHDLTFDSENQKLINKLVLDWKFEEAQDLLKKTMASEKDDRAEDTAEVLWWPRSWEARKLEEASNGKIVLRPDGKIDFPELGIKGMGRLSVEWPTDLEYWLVQWSSMDNNEVKWVPWISYMTWERAMREAAKQGKKLLPANGSEEKTKAFLATLWNNWTEQSKAFQALFWEGFSGFFDMHHKEWFNVGFASYVGLSDANGVGNVISLRFSASDSHWGWDNQRCPRPFLACEDCSWRLNT